MRSTAAALTALALLVICSVAQSQMNSTIASDKKSASSDVPNRSSRPKLSLQDALRKAEEFIASEKIDASRHWLYRAQYLVLGDSATPDKGKLPGWHFWWLSDSAEAGNYIEIFVSMDGKCVRLPSM